MDDVDIICCIQEPDMTNQNCKTYCRERSNCVYAFFEEGAAAADDDTCTLVSSKWQQNQLFDGDANQQIVKLSDCDVNPICPQNSNSKQLFCVCFMIFVKSQPLSPYSLCLFVHLVCPFLIIICKIIVSQLYTSEK